MTKELFTPPIQAATITDRFTHIIIWPGTACTIVLLLSAYLLKAFVLTNM